MSRYCDLERAAQHLRNHGLVVMPTETVYGLAANACDDLAVAKVFAAKQRPTFDPLIVHVADAAQAWTVAQTNPLAEVLAAAFWPGPLTLVLPRRPGRLADLVSSGLDSVGVRCPDHPLARALIQASALPLAAPSANLFGRTSPTCIEHIGEDFPDALLLDGGPCRVGLESTVLSCLGSEPLILRPGGVSREDLRAVLGFSPRLASHYERASHLPALAPGMLQSHYAPRTPLILRPSPAAPWPQGPQWGICAFTQQDLPQHVGAQEVLSPQGDPLEAASRLFACLRRLDASAATRLCAELIPSQEGLSLAINDRLRRAAG